MRDARNGLGQAGLDIKWLAELAVAQPVAHPCLVLALIAVLGLLAGATTNTPSLGAAQQTLQALSAVDPGRAALPALAYAVG